jgi:hypothetical protein
MIFTPRKGTVCWWNELEEQFSLKVLSHRWENLIRNLMCSLGSDQEGDQRKKQRAGNVSDRKKSTRSPSGISLNELLVSTAYIFFPTTALTFRMNSVVLVVI